MSDLSERIREIVGEIRDITAGFCSGDLDSKLLKSSDEWADQILALFKQEPVLYIASAEVGGETMYDMSDVKSGPVVVDDDGWDYVPLYADPVVPEGERVEGWAGLMRVGVNSEPPEPVDGCWEFVAEKQADPYTREEYRRAILIFPEDKP